MEKEKVLEKYKSKKLCIPSYRLDRIYMMDDLIKKDILLFILDELWSHESELTVDGFNFLMDYYGKEQLIPLMMADHCEMATYSPEELSEWIDSLKDRAEKYT